jgi:hypothetical protein
MTDTTRYDELAGGEQRGKELLEDGDRKPGVDTLGGEEHGPDTLGGPQPQSELLEGGEQRGPETISTP